MASKFALTVYFALAACGTTLVDHNGSTGVRRIGSAGGTVSGDGVTLVIPKDALDHEVKIVITTISPAPAGGETAVSIEPVAPRGKRSRSSPADSGPCLPTSVPPRPAPPRR